MQTAQVTTTLDKMTEKAHEKCMQGKYACEALTELRYEYPRVRPKTIRAAIERIRQSYDFPTKREIGRY